MEVTYLLVLQEGLTHSEQHKHWCDREFDISDMGEFKKNGSLTFSQ